MTEIWKQVNGFETYYEVSNTGKVRSLPRIRRTTFGERVYGGYEVKPIFNNHGYFVVNLTADKKRSQMPVHRVVLDSFVRTKEHGEVCRHLDGNKENNNINNLVWGTQKENVNDQLIHGTQRIGELNGSSKLCESSVRYIRSTSKTTEELSIELNVSSSCIKKARRCETWARVK